MIMQMYFTVSLLKKVADEFIQENEISYGTFDNVKRMQVCSAGLLGVGEVYERLIEDCYSDGKILTDMGGISFLDRCSYIGL